MERTYSTYQAKARFSEILRKVRGGQRVIVSYHGKPVAEIKPLAKEEFTFEKRIEALEAAGTLVPARASSAEALRPIARRPGALQRFLDSRD